MIHVSHNGIQRSSSTLDGVLFDEELLGGEARDLLLALLDSTIRFQKLQALRSQVHTHSSNPDVLHSIDDLQARRADVRELAAAAERDGLRLRVRSTIEVEAQPLGADELPADGNGRHR